MKRELIILILLLIVAVPVGNSFSQVKAQEQTQVDEGSPLFINGNMIGKDTGANLLQTSIITPYAPELMPSYFFAAGRDNIKNGYSTGWFGNLPVKRIFQVLYGPDINHRGDLYFEPFPVPNSRTQFKELDSSKFVAYLNGAVQNQNLYTMQFMAKIDLPVAKIRKKMISDLESCFGLKTSWEKQVKKCIILSRSKVPLTTYREGPACLKWGNNLIDLNGIQMDQFIARMTMDRQFFNSAYPIVDETNFKDKLGKISFPISDQKIDYAFLSRELPKYGLTLSIQDRLVDVLIISPDK